MVRQIVGKGTHGFSDSPGRVATERLRPLDQVGREVGEQTLELEIRVVVCQFRQMIAPTVSDRDAAMGFWI